MPLKDPEARRAYLKKRYEENKEVLNAYSRERHQRMKDDPEYRAKRKIQETKWREENREAYLAIKRRGYQKNNERRRDDARARGVQARASKLPPLLAIITEAKSIGCVRCREMDEVCLDFHHVNPAEKSFTIGKEVQRLKPPDVLIAEIRKCMVLCANCHRRFHAKVFALPEIDLDTYWADRLGCEP